jgi:hypothetical protein
MDNPPGQNSRNRRFTTELSPSLPKEELIRRVARRVTNRQSRRMMMAGADVQLTAGVTACDRWKSRHGSNLN